MEKVLILANSLNGLYNFRKELISALSERYSVIASVPKGEREAELVALGCTVVTTEIDRRGIAVRTDYRLYKEYKELIRTVKPAFVITYTIKPNLYGGYACRKLGVPHFANITGLGTAFEKGGPLKVFILFLYRVCLKRTRTVFCENEGNMHTLVSLGAVRQAQCHCLKGAGVNLTCFPYVPYPTREKTTRFLFVGRIMKEKGVDELFYAAERLKSEGYDIAVDLVGSYEEDYKGIISALSANGTVAFHGYSTHVADYYAHCNCFVLASYHEGMANVLLEAAATGRPLIASDIYGCREAVEEGENGFLCKVRDGDSLYEAMKRFCELSYAEKEAMGVRSREIAESVFDKNKVVADTLSQIYARI